ncbi:DUF7010 family protein [Metabacillus malikii]|uniref:Uncharacterized protein n=1 Tax=Metabacillus malikii TaxID=1504265 RepID=A0ABT9ZAY1_9BACI|nr:hypothetical protein [Metabacillus malikii]MDQ0229155.1 hypothetical protein [Metabacillus malikii]
MTQTTSTISGTEVRETASGVFFMAFFGTLWAYTGIMGLQGWGVALLLVAAIAIGIVLFLGGVLLIHGSRRLTSQVPKVDLSQKKRTTFRFNIIFAAEGLAIAIAIAVCHATQRIELLPIVIAMIVGVHFIPLAHLFKVRLYYVTGILLCLLAIMTLLFVPLKLTMGGHKINAFMSVVGFGSAIIIWGTGLAIWLIGSRLLGKIQTT